MRAAHKHDAGSIGWRMAVTAILFALMVGASAVATAEDEYVSATSSAWLAADTGFEGYWKYCITVTWNVRDFSDPAHSLSHVSILLGLETCSLVCQPGYFAFDDTVGTSSGYDGCTVYYYSEFNCKGEPTIPVHVPTLKFEPFATSCEPGVAGTAHVCFYSVAPPKVTTAYPSSVWIKFGQNVTSGKIEGALPGCRFAGVEASTWGRIKALID